MHASLNQWIPKGVLVGASVASLVLFLASLIAIPIIVVKLPANYFDPKRPREEKPSHPAARVAAKVVKNLVGFVFLLCGVAMILLPGQGVLTIVIGLSLMDLPKKHALIVKLVQRPSIYRGIDSVRRRFGKAPLVMSSA